MAMPQSIWLPNNFRKAFAHFGHVYLMCLIFVKICPFWARLINVAENFNENRISCLNLIYFYCRENHKHEMRFCLNLKLTTNGVYWWNFWIFLYFFVHLLRALPTFLFGKLLLFYVTWKFSKINTSFLSGRMSLRRLAKLYKNPRARLNLLVSPV